MKNIIAIKLHKNDKNINTLDSIIRFRDNLRKYLGDECVVVCIPSDEIDIEKINGDFKLISIDGIDYTIDDITALIANSNSE